MDFPTVLGGLVRYLDATHCKGKNVYPWIWIHNNGLVTPPSPRAGNGRDKAWEWCFELLPTAFQLCLWVCECFMLLDKTGLAWRCIPQAALNLPSRLWQQGKGKAKTPWDFLVAVFPVYIFVTWVFQAFILKQTFIFKCWAGVWYTFTFCQFWEESCKGCNKVLNNPGILLVLGLRTHTQEH